MNQLPMPTPPPALAHLATDLGSLRPADTVLVRSGWGYYSFNVGVVVKTTATQVVVDLHGREARFSKNRGFRRLGGDSGGEQLVPALEHNIRKYQEQVTRDFFRRVASYDPALVLDCLGWPQIVELMRFI